MKLSDLRNVDDVVRGNICCGCGACYAACPVSAIVMRKNESVGVYTPEIDKKICINCGMCVSVCYGFNGLNTCEQQGTVMHNGDFLYDSDIGCFKRIYVGYSNDQELRFSASSGGLVTEILRYCIKNQIADGAVVARMKCNGDINSEAFIARSEKEVMEAIGSKYFPTTNCACIKSILMDKSDNKKKYIFVGLPCQVSGLNYLKKFFPFLKNKILFSIGLFCGHLVDFAGTSALLKANGISSKLVFEIKYRGNGWPGDIQIKQLNKKYTYPLTQIWPDFFENNLFTPRRCMLCSDFFSEAADLSIGDAWDQTLLDRKSNGYSLAIVRSGIAFDFLKKIVNANVLSVRSYSSHRMKEVFSKNIFYKKNLNKLRLSHRGFEVSFYAFTLIYEIFRLFRYGIKFKFFRKLYNKTYSGVYKIVYKRYKLVKKEPV